MSHNATSDHMTVERVFNSGSYWSCELHGDGRHYATVNYCDAEDAQAVVDRWNEHAELLAFVRQVAVAEVGTLSLDCAPTAARTLLNRLGRTEG